jgi:hypothetical protein
VRVYQFRHFGSYGKGIWCPTSLASCASDKLQFVGHLLLRLGYFFFVGAGDGVKTVEVGTATGAAGVGVAAGVGSASCSGTPDCKTEFVPVTIGSERISANNMNPAAAPIVILASSVCVPLGPNAVLDTELENNAPASDFPGCSKTVTTRMMHDKINSP